MVMIFITQTRIAQSDKAHMTCSTDTFFYKPHAVALIPIDSHTLRC